MGWFNRRKPRDLIADSNAEWEVLRAAEGHASNAIAVVQGVSGQEFQDQMLIAAGGWCAPSKPYSLFDLPEIQIKRGGIKWPTNP